ncbi:MAG: hypothetical protein KDA77_13250 [Planctomycetaceae bacterium]|nr:hypothetical protein [Planctomycetaceae bacterium]
MMDQISDNTAKVGGSYLKAAVIGLICLIVMGLIVVVGFKLFVVETSLTISNSSSQEMRHCVLSDHEGRELFRAESMSPDEKVSTILYNLKLSGDLTFQATLVDGTTRQGVFSFDEERDSMFDLTSLSYEITDQKLISKSETELRIPIKERIRLRVFW